MQQRRPSTAKNKKINKYIFLKKKESITREENGSVGGGGGSILPVFWEDTIRPEAWPQIVVTAQSSLPVSRRKVSSKVTGEEGEALQSKYGRGVEVGGHHRRVGRRPQDTSSPEKDLCILEANGLNGNWGKSRGIVRV